MGIQLYNSLHKKVVPFETREPGRVYMYVCGPTVYNHIHIGNARTFLWFEFIRRYLKYRGYEVTYVMNYTDVDDKIIERANLEGIPTEGITRKYTDAFESALNGLGSPPADIICKATDHIADMVAAIEKLIESEHAYAVDGDVFFSVESFTGYGKLSGRSLDDMRQGEQRVEPHAGKRDPIDFALWKAAKEGEPSWPSPWGPGRPGWHIECSVMSTKYLGNSFDIHGGGSDLTFPHHENEVAQAEALTGVDPFVRNWLHAGMVQMDDTKMSKSLGNVVTAKDAVERYPAEAVRYWALAASYRSQVVFSQSALDDAIQGYDRWRTFFDSARHVLKDDMPEASLPLLRKHDEDIDDATVERFVQAMDDDFNSAGSYAVVHDLVRDANKSLEAAQRGDASGREELIGLTKTFLELTGVLGFDFETAGASSEVLANVLDYLIELREQARADKDFAKADQIRERLESMGISLEDTPAGPRWRIEHERG
jgi:cysteinyl-tRNA synthetase